MKRMFSYFFLLAILSVTACGPEKGNVIMTVEGPVPVSDMGTTLTHEHLLVDFIGADSTGYNRWDRDSAATRIIPYVREVMDLGVQTLVECTPAYLGRDPELLRMIARETGIHLVTNTGYYGAHGNRFIPEQFYRMTPVELSEQWIEEFEHGIEGTGIRPGFIKIAVDRDDTLSPEHVKIVTAAAHTHNATGLVIASHTGPDGPAFEQIRILRSLGVNPSSFIWVHADLGTLEGNTRAASLGSWISLDKIGSRGNLQPGEKFSMAWYSDRILALKEAGHLDRLLISHDAGWYAVGQGNGGTYRGYTGIFESLIPALLEKGFTRQEVDQILIRNPGTAFSIPASRVDQFPDPG